MKKEKITNLYSSATWGCFPLLTMIIVRSSLSFWAAQIIHFVSSTHRPNGWCHVSVNFGGAQLLHGGDSSTTHVAWDPKWVLKNTQKSPDVLFFNFFFPTPLGIHAKNMVLYHYPLVICYSSPWKITIFKNFGKPSTNGPRSSIFHGYVSHNQRVLSILPPQP